MSNMFLLIISWNSIAWASSIFDCAQTFTLPASKMGSMPYQWVASSGGRAVVKVRFTIGSDGRAKDLADDAKVFNLGRWIRGSIKGSTFKQSCAGMTFEMRYDVIIHLKTSVDLPATTIGPGNRIQLEYLDIEYEGDNIERERPLVPGKKAGRRE